MHEIENKSAKYNKYEIKLEILSIFRSSDSETSNKMTSPIATEQSYVNFEIAGNCIRNIKL